MKYLYAFLFISLCSSCLITINENNYRSLNNKQKQDLRQYPAAYNSTKLNSLIEITGLDVQKALKDKPYTWVHRWIPFCKSANCMPLFYYDKIAMDHAHKGLQVFTISTIYTPKSIRNALSRSSYHNNIYVMKDAHYGHKTRKNLIMFTAEMSANDTIRMYTPSHYIFKGEQLVYYGDKMTGAIMDSVMWLN